VPILHQLNPALKLNKERKTVQLWPQIHGTDAMFIALLQKAGGLETSTTDAAKADTATGDPEATETTSKPQRKPRTKSTAPKV
jgi:hypothetical protein